MHPRAPFQRPICTPQSCALRLPECLLTPPLRMGLRAHRICLLRPLWTPSSGRCAATYHCLEVLPTTGDVLLGLPLLWKPALTSDLWKPAHNSYDSHDSHSDKVFRWRRALLRATSATIRTNSKANKYSCGDPQRITIFRPKSHESCEFGRRFHPTSANRAISTIAPGFVRLLRSVAFPPDAHP